MNINDRLTRREAVLSVAAAFIDPTRNSVPTGATGATRAADAIGTTRSGPPPAVGNDVFSLMAVTSVDARPNWNETIPKTSNKAQTPDIDITGAGLITGILAVYDEVLYPATFRDNAGNVFVLGQFYLPPAERNFHVAIQPFHCIAPKGGAGWHINSIGSPHHSILVGVWKTKVPIQENARMRRAVAGPSPGIFTPNWNNALIVTGAAGVNNAGRIPTIDGGFSVIDGFSGKGADMIVMQAALAPRTPATVAPTWTNVGNEVCSTLMVFEPKAA